MALPTTGVPGVKTTRTATPRRVLLTDVGAIVLRKNLLIDGSHSRDPLNTGDVQYLRAGMLLGKVTTGSLYAPSLMGVTTVRYDNADSSKLLLTVSVATAEEVSRRLTAGAGLAVASNIKVIGPPTANGTVAIQVGRADSVDVSTGIITLNAALGADAWFGSFVCANDGSEIPLGILGGSELGWGYPVKVTDEDEASEDQPLTKLLVGGQVDSSQIINWPTDTSLQNFIRAALNGGVVDLLITTAEHPARGPFIFDDRY